MVFSRKMDRDRARFRVGVRLGLGSVTGADVGDGDFQRGAANVLCIRVGDDIK